MAGTILTYSLVDEAARALNDSGLAWFSTDTAEVYRGFLLDHILANESTYQLTKRGTGIYTYSTGNSPVHIIPADDPEFTAETGVTYRLYCKGLKIYATVGAPTATTITVAGTRVDFVEATAVLYEYLAAHKSQQIAESLGGVSLTPDDVTQRLLNMAGCIRGAMGI